MKRAAQTGSTHPARAAIAALVLSATALCVANAVRADEPHGFGAVRIEFAPSLRERLEKDYGAGEEGVLRGDLMSALAEAPASCRPWSVAVLIEDVRPSHPTRAQSLRDPSLDPAESRSLGWAQLRATVTDTNGAVIRQADEHYRPASLHFASPSLDPWADARIGFQRLAAQLARACPR